MFKRVLQAAAAAGVMGFAPFAAARADATICTSGSLTLCVGFTFGNAGPNTYTLQVAFLSSNQGGSLYQFGLTDGANSFGLVGTGSILTELRDAGGDVIGVDWRTPIDEAWERIGFDHAVQGNLDPTLLLGPMTRVMSAADDILARIDSRPGHIFNLGHGILPSTPVDHIQSLARYIHQRTRQA